MKKYFETTVTALIILLISTLFVFGQDKYSPNVTVYNNNLGVIREIRPIDINSGISTIKITDVAEKIDPTSVHIKLDGTVLEQNYQYDLVSQGKILQKYLDKEISLSGKDIISGKLLSAGENNIVLQKNDGGLLMVPDIKDYRISVGSLPEGLITKPTLVWMVESQKTGRQDVELSYQTKGMNWHAEYVAVLSPDDKSMDLNAWVSVENNSGSSYKNAKLKLVAGSVNIIQPNLNMKEFYVRGSRANAITDSGEQFAEKSFFEYHIYDLQRKTTIAGNETKQVSLFEAENIKIQKKYLYKGKSYNKDKDNAEVVVEFENKEANHLGMPFPAGKIRLNKSDGKSLEFVGEDMIQHTPKNEKVTLKVGDAFDVLIEEKEVDRRKISNKVNEVTYSIKISNRKDEDIEVEVRRNMGSYWEILKSSEKWEKKDASTAVFKVPVKKDDESELVYTVRNTY